MSDAIIVTKLRKLQELGTINSDILYMKSISDISQSKSTVCKVVQKESRKKTEQRV